MRKVDVYLGETPDGQPVVLPDYAFWQHALLVAPTGFGKTFLLLLILLQLGVAYGMFVGDRVGTLVRLMRRHFAAHWHDLSPAMRRRIIYLNPTDDLTFSLDPLVTEHTGKRFYSFMHRRIETVMRFIGRKQGLTDYKEQNRRGRVMRLVLWLAAIRDPHNPRDRHYGFHRANELLNIGTPAWNRIYAKRRRFLPPDVAAEWDRLRRMSPHARNLETESTRNFFDQFLASERLKEMVAPGRPALDARRCIRDGFIVLADLSDGEFFSPEEADAISSLLIVLFTEAGRVEKCRFVLVFEEIEKVLHQDLGDLLARARNDNAACFVVAQDLSSFKNQFADITPKALSQPNLHFTFMQKEEDSLRRFAALHGTASLDFSRNFLPMDRPDGFDVLTLRERLDGGGITDTREHQQSFGRQRGRQREFSTAAESGFERHEGHESGNSNEHTDRQQNSNTNDVATTRTAHVQDGKVVSVNSKGTTEKRSHVNSSDHSRGSHESTNTGNSWKESHEKRSAVGETAGESSSIADSVSRTICRQTAINQRNHIIHQHRADWFPHGLVFEVPTQQAIVQFALRRLAPRQLLMGWGHRESVFVHVGEVIDPFDGRELVAELKVRQFLQEVYSNHDFYFIPKGPRPCRLTGECETNGYSLLSDHTHPVPTSGSAPASSPITKLLHDVQQSLQDENGTDSGTSEVSK